MQFSRTAHSVGIRSPSGNSSRYVFNEKARGGGGGGGGPPYEMDGDARRLA